MDDIAVERIVQLIPSSGLWLRKIVLDGEPLAGSEFVPVAAIALVEIVSPHERFFVSQGLLPVTSDDLMRGLIEKFPNEGLRIERQIYHDADFIEVGVVLKPGAKSRSHFDYGTASGLDFARFLADRERRRAAEGL